MEGVRRVTSKGVGVGVGGGKSPVFVLHCLSAQTSRSCCCLVPFRALGKKLKKAPSSC